MRRIRHRCIRMGIACLLTISAAPLVHADTGGALDAHTPGGQLLGSCPLRHTDVDVDIIGMIARVTVQQQFENPYDEPIEAVYTFPLSDKGAVDRMTMQIGDRTIEGVIKKREDARRLYEQAKQAGQAASLLNQERPNIFTQSVANILPGEKVDITISYTEILAYGEGAYTFAFPMTIGPRYMPAGAVPDAERIAPPVPAKGVRAGHDIGLRVNLDAGVPVTDIASELHSVTVERDGSSRATIKLDQKDSIPNRDFVLRYGVAGERIEDAVLTYRDARGEFFTVVMQPPVEVEADEATPKELIFVIDCSGSMRGFPLAKAKAAMAQCIKSLHPEDTFNLVSFAGGVGYCFNAPVANTDENREKALRYLDSLEGSGGTEMMKAINAALQSRPNPDRLRVVCFMTDGFIGNDMEILGAVQKNAGHARVFAFGIGNSVNRFLIEGMAREGRGAAEIVTLESDGDEAVARFWKRVRSPLVHDINVDFAGFKVDAVYPDPNAVPDLFAGEPLVLVGRVASGRNGSITITGSSARGAFERTFDVDFRDVDESREALAKLWARKHVDDLMRQDWNGMQMGSPRAEISEAITQTGLKYAMVTQFTSFVAVEDRIINEGGRTKTVHVPVEMPDGVSHEGIFGAQRAMASPPPPAAPLPAMELSRPAVPQGAPMPEARVNQEIAVEGLSDVRNPLPSAADERDEAEDSLPVIIAGESDGAWISKLDAALQQRLETHPKSHQKLQVFLYLDEISDTNLAKLKRAGVEVVAEARSKKAVFVEVSWDKLREVARFTFVKKIALSIA